MAEPTISASYEGLQQAVAVARGWNTTVADWTATNTLQFEEGLKRGLARFYYPEMMSTVYRRKEGQPLETVEPTPSYDSYEWSFLRKSGSITLVAAQKNYAMPDDFSGAVLDETVVYAVGQSKKPLSSVDPGTMEAMRSQENATGVPLYYCLRPQTFVAATGTRWDMEVYPLPTASEASLVISFDYSQVTDTISAGEYPLGGANHAQTIRAAVLAELEKMLDDDPQGVYEMSFQRLLQASIRMDRQLKLSLAGSRFAYPTKNLPTARLGVDFFELQRVVGEDMGFNPNPWTWDHATTQKVRRVIRSGYRIYLYPEPIDTQTKGHEWSFIRPTMRFKTAADERYYMLPDDFERVHGDIHYDATSQTGYPMIKHVPLSRLQEHESIADYTSHPSFFAVRPVGTDGQAWQRQELILDPTPDAEYSLVYEYIANQRELDDEHPYPLGADSQAELLFAACRAMAELEKTRRKGEWYNRYRILLVSAVAADLRRVARVVGYNGNGGGNWPGGRGRLRRAGLVGYSTTTYNGVEYRGD